MSDYEDKVEALKASVDEIWQRVQTAYDKMQETHDGADVAAYREAQAEWLAIPEHIRQPPVPRGPGDAHVVVGAAALSKDGADSQ